MSNVNTSVTKINFEGNFSTYVFLKCLFLAFSRLKSDCSTSRHLLSKKILNYLECVEFRILVGG